MSSAAAFAQSAAVVSSEHNALPLSGAAYRVAQDAYAAYGRGDYSGAICEIDISGATPVVKPPVTMQNGYALSGDMVGIDTGTVFGSAYKLSDATTQNNNILVKVDVTTGAVTQIGATGYPKLFGVAFQENKVFGFTHDQSGRVVTIDTTTGAGTMFGTFKDASNQPISFAGAGVSSLITIQ